MRLKYLFLSFFISILALLPIAQAQFVDDPFFEDTKATRALIKEILRSNKKLKRKINQLTPSYIGRINEIFKTKTTDSDQDGAADLIENAYGYNSAQPDSDSSGLSDGAELAQLLFIGELTSPGSDSLCITNKLNNKEICAEAHEEITVVDNNDQPIDITSLIAGDCLQANESTAKVISHGSDFRYYYYHYIKKLDPALCS